MTLRPTQPQLISVVRLGAIRLYSGTAPRKHNDGATKEKPLIRQRQDRYERNV